LLSSPDTCHCIAPRLNAGGGRVSPSIWAAAATTRSLAFDQLVSSLSVEFFFIRKAHMFLTRSGLVVELRLPSVNACGGLLAVAAIVTLFTISVAFTSNRLGVTGRR
jgi:hypothetical protein